VFKRYSPVQEYACPCFDLSCVHQVISAYDSLHS
jgi:hypothetical protein